MTADDILADLVGAVYEAAYDSSLWPAFLQRFADAFRGENTALVIQDARTNRNTVAIDVRGDPQHIRTYNQYYAGCNPWLSRPAMELAGKRAVAGEMIYPAEDLVRTEFYHDWLRPQKLKHTIGAVIFQERDRVAICSSIRPAAAGAASPRELDLLEAFLPHARRALLAAERMQGAFQLGRCALGILEELPRACVLVDAAARPLFANRAARRLESGGMTMGATGLAFPRRIDTERLHGLVRLAAASPASAGEMAVARDRAQPLLILVSPLPRRDSPFAPVPAAAAVWISDPGRGGGPAPERIRRLFGLTRAEAALAAELAGGSSLYEAAASLAISRQTARNHLKHIFEKTGVHRQADLVRLLLSCPHDALGS